MANTSKTDEVCRALGFGWETWHIQYTGALCIKEPLNMREKKRSSRGFSLAAHTLLHLSFMIKRN